MIVTSYHYKLSNKHVPEVSTVVWNCLNELEWFEESACLPWSLRTRIVINYLMTEQEPVQKQGGIRGNLPCGQEVLVDSRCQIWLSNNNNTRILKTYCTHNSNSAKRHNGQLVRKLFQPEELCTVVQKDKKYNSASETDFPMSLTYIRLDTDASRLCVIRKIWSRLCTLHSRDGQHSVSTCTQCLWIGTNDSHKVPTVN